MPSEIGLLIRHQVLIKYFRKLQTHVSSPQTRGLRCIQDAEFVQVREGREKSGNKLKSGQISIYHAGQEKSGILAVRQF